MTTWRGDPEEKATLFHPSDTETVTGAQSQPGKRRHLIKTAGVMQENPLEVHSYLENVLLRQGNATLRITCQRFIFPLAWPYLTVLSDRRHKPAQFVSC